MGHFLLFTIVSTLITLVSLIAANEQEKVDILKEETDNTNAEAKTEHPHLPELPILSPYS